MQVPKWRWGLIRQALAYLLLRRVPLMRCFRLSAFTGMVDDDTRQGAGRDVELKLRLVETTIQDCFFAIQFFHNINKMLINCLLVNGTTCNNNDKFKAFEYVK